MGSASHASQARTPRTPAAHARMLGWERLSPEHSLHAAGQRTGQRQCPGGAKGKAGCRLWLGFLRDSVGQRRRGAPRLPVRGRLGLLCVSG